MPARSCSVAGGGRSSGHDAGWRPCPLEVVQIAPPGCRPSGLRREVDRRNSARVVAPEPRTAAEKWSSNRCLAGSAVRRLRPVDRTRRHDSTGPSCPAARVGRRGPRRRPAAQRARAEPALGRRPDDRCAPRWTRSSPRASSSGGTAPGPTCCPRPFARVLGLTTFTQDMRTEGLVAGSRVLEFERQPRTPRSPSGSGSRSVTPSCGSPGCASGAASRWRSRRPGSPRRARPRAPARRTSTGRCTSCWPALPDRPRRRADHDRAGDARTRRPAGCSRHPGRPGLPAAPDGRRATRAAG